MKNIWVLLILAAVVMGCSRFGGGGPSTNSGANASSTPVAKVVDLPGLLGKSLDEMNTALGQKQKLSVGTVTFEIPKGSVYAQYDKTNKQVLLSFSFKDETVGGVTVRGYPSVDKLGQAVGLDIKGTPDKSEFEDKYYDYLVNGKKCTLTIKKMGDAYTEASLYCP